YSPSSRSSGMLKSLTRTRTTHKTMKPTKSKLFEQLRVLFKDRFPLTMHAFDSYRSLAPDQRYSVSIRDSHRIGEYYGRYELRLPEAETRRAPLAGTEVRDSPPDCINLP